MVRLFLGVVLSLLLLEGALAQVKVTGKITDQSKVPLPNVSVIIKGTTKGIVADFEGIYHIEVNPGDVLEFSYLGFQTVTKKINENQPTLTLDVVMIEQAEELDDVIIVGYGTSTKKSLISSVSTVKSEALTDVPLTNITQGLAGRAPGLVIKGGAGLDNKSSITIRGGNDNEQPLVVIDGIIRDYDDFVYLLPEDIASISILKDASATAVYGARAANGILQITTIRGKEGRTSFEYDHSLSFSQPSIFPKKLNAYQWATANNVAKKNDGQPITYTDDILQKILDGSDPLNYSDTDWKKLVLKEFSEQYKHNLRVTGGSQNNQYLLSLGYLKKGSLYRSGTHNMDVINFRLNQTFGIGNSGVKGFASVDGYLKNVEHPFTSTSGSYKDLFSHIMTYRTPIEPAVNKYGLPYVNTPENPLAETSAEAGYIRDKAQQINAMIGLEWAIPWVEGVKAKTNFNYRYFTSKSKQWQKDPPLYEWDSQTPIMVTPPNLYKLDTENRGYTTQSFLEYTNSFNEHFVSALAGYEASYSFGDRLSHRRLNYIFPIDQFNAGPKENMEASGGEAEQGRAGFVAQAKYNYDYRYFLEFGLRHDGSDLFPKSKRWGTFFSGSLGWSVADESFMAYLKEKHIFDVLKLRASYGEVGNDSGVERFSYIRSYLLNEEGYVTDGKLSPGIYEGAIPSPDITWYTDKQLTFGLDFEAANNRLFGSLDYFFFKTVGFLTTPDPLLSGYTLALGKELPLVPSNSERRREGFEGQLGWRDSFGEFQYSISGNFTIVNQLHSNNPEELLQFKKNPYQRQSQHTDFYGIGLKSDGFYTDANDVYQNPQRGDSKNLVAGDIKYQDFNGDGQIDSADLVRIGQNRFPKTNYGININLSYRAFSFNILFQGATSYDLYIESSLTGGNAFMSSSTPQFDFQLDYWTPENTNAKFPRLMSSPALNGRNNVTTSDFWLINGAYFRLKDFAISYDLKKYILKENKYFDKMRISLSGQNIFTISQANKYGMDPEIMDSSILNYPNERTYSIGLSVGF